MTRQAFVTHQKGSWKWQDRFALVEYIAQPRKRDGVLIWKSHRVLNGKIKPGQVRGFTVGSLHNKVLSPEELAAYHAGY